MSSRKTDKAYELLKGYSGTNPYISMIRRNVISNGNADSLNDFSAEFIIRNIGQEPLGIGRTVRITEWFGEKKKEDWKTDFTPVKLRIVSYLGETDRKYCCYVQYRKSVPPCMCFIPKNAVIDNFFVTDYNCISVDFDRYDRLSTAIDRDRVLMNHQKTAVKFLLGRRKCILADQQGLGKTTSLAVAAIEGNFDSVLIICPASLKNNWKNELMWYVPEKDITVVDGFLSRTKAELEEFLGYSVGKSGKKKDELMSEAKEVGKWVDNRFVIINFDILDEFYTVSRVTSEESVRKLMESNPLLRYLYNRKSLIIVDEAHKLSNSTSTRYKVINDLIRRTVPHSIYLSTGTPVTNMPENLFCLLKLLDAPIACDWNYYTERYCGANKIYAKGEFNRLKDIWFSSHGKEGWRELSKEEVDECKKYIDDHARKISVMEEPTNIEELKEVISYLYMRRTKEDVTDLPKKHIHELRYSLNEQQVMEYDKLWDEYEASKTAENPDKELNKELLEGAIYRTYLAEQMVPKTIALVDDLISKGEKVVIACCYDNELYALREYYGKRCVIFNGKCNLKQKDSAISEFKGNDGVMVFIGNIIASGVGITLTNSHTLIFNSYDYVYANNSQMEDRVHRIGQKNECNIYYQMFNDTHCEHMWDIVLKKQYLSDTLITSQRPTVKTVGLQRGGDSPMRSPS